MSAAVLRIDVRGRAVPTSAAAATAAVGVMRTSAPIHLIFYRLFVCTAVAADLLMNAAATAAPIATSTPI